MSKINQVSCYLVKGWSQQGEKNLRSDEHAQNLGSRDAFIDYGA